MPSVLELVTGSVFSLIDKLIPDKAAADKAKLDTLRLAQDGHFKELDMAFQQQKLQTDINIEEAKSPDNFRGGWRPFIGWVCGLAFASNVIVRPYVAAFAHVDLPALESDALMSLMFGMLGLGGYRTFEKVKGVQ